MVSLTLTDEQKRVLSFIDEREITRFLQQLIRQNSENPPGREANVARIIFDELNACGATVEAQPIEKNRYNVLGTCKGSSEQKMLFNGHMDTVPLGNRTAWHGSALSGEIRNGCIFGRGAADMKGGLTAQIFAFKAMMKSGLPRKRGLLLTAVIDEEVNFKGTKKLISEGKLDACEFGYVAEPSSLNIATCLKGGIEFVARTYGKSVHTGVAFNGDNAIAKMGKVILALERYNCQLRERKNVPYLKYPTLNIGTICGGSAVTMVPDVCAIAFDRQVLPEEDPLEAEAEVRQVIRNIKSEVELKKMQSFNTWSVDQNARVASRLAEAYQMLSDRRPDYCGFNGYSEVELLSKAGIPSVIFGPGNIRVAHAANEYVSIKQVVDAARVYALLAYQYVCCDD
ncbi:MAG: M20 family metallopeptidase [Sporolactobacillus sp.]|jgi:acetylornithine deacetylase/succinyl-diaminopimelate desuccinylase family protein|nr:M20 family metallopeptidase [Sporolactobacillus sp.]